VESKTLNPWELPPSVLESALPEIFNRASRHEQTYVAYCPLLRMKEPSNGAWPLGPHVFLRFYSHLERLQYLTRHAENIPVQDLSSLSLSQDLGRMDIPLLEISITVNREDHHPPGGRARMFSETIEERLADALDVAKWSLMLGFQVNTPPQEATITYEDALGGTLPRGFGVFPRQGRSSGILYEFEEEKIAQCRAWFAMIQAARALNPSVRQALWYWGRSALHRLDRDILLDSVIGLENLLVPNPGQSTYRFGLHGAALLAASAEESIAIAKELRRLYGQRSRAAHGSPSERNDDAWTAFGHLSRAIAALAEMLYSSMIQSSPKADVAMQLEELVLRRAILHPREGS
jgi:hypothetical protein